MTCVYFIQCESSGLIKIGTTGDMTARLSQLRTGSTTDLRVLGTEPGGKILEAVRHTEFAGDRVRREWFRPSKAILRHIEANCCPYVEGRRERKALPGTSLCDDRVAVLLGVVRSYATQMRLGYKPIPLDLALRLFELEGARVGPIASATTSEIETLRRFVLAAPHFERKAA